MENKTALQLFIQYLEAQRSAYVTTRDGWKPESGNYATYDLLVRQYDIDINKAKALVDTTEREQLEDAYKSGYADSRSGLEQDKSFYTTTYKTT